MRIKLLGTVIAAILLTASAPKSKPADLILTDARVYSLRWGEPGLDGTPAMDAPYANGQWRPDAQAVAMRGGRIVYVGSDRGALALRGKQTRVIDLNGATVIPGLVDSHTHFIELGAKLEAVDLTHVTTEEQAVALVAQRAKSVPKGEWIFGAGWDEGAWANRYPDKARLSAAVPDHPVVLRSLHGFAVWTNQAALDAGKITAASPVPTGGEMRLGADGAPSGLFLNRASQMVDAIVPPVPQPVAARHALRGLKQMARDGYVTVHEAGADSLAMATLQQLEDRGRLPIRVYAMLSLRDAPLMKQWIARGPDKDSGSMLVTRSVKAYYDGALGSRGARLLADYADKPGHRGISGAGYGFDRDLARQALKAGFQLGIHAIGDAGNREVLDFLEADFKADPKAARNRHRIEHAQVVAPQDQPRLAKLGVIASMEPPHAVEDMPWAETRLGPQRIKGAYAWRSLRQQGARLTFNADNPGSDHSIFYGLHAAITRRDKALTPPGGWYPREALTIEETVRAYTLWSAWAAFREAETGMVAKGRWADLTVMDIDPFALAAKAPEKILGGKIVLTVVNGKVVYRDRVREDAHPAATNLADGSASLTPLPQRTWELRFTVDRPVLGKGAVKLELGHDRVSQLQDRILTPESFDAPGNIGSGTRSFAQLTLDAPLDSLGLKSFRGRFTGTVQTHSVRDPITGLDRPWSGFRPEWSLNFELRLDLDNLFNVAGERSRLFFDPNRTSPQPVLSEFRHRNQHVVVAVSVNRTL